MKRLTGLMTIAAVAIGTWASAQTPADLEQIARNLRRNQEEIRTYTWDSKVTFIVNGEQRRSDTYQVRFDENGWLQRLQTDSEIAKGAVRGPDGKKLKKKEREAALAFVTEAKNQLDAYLNPLHAEKAVRTSTVTTDIENLLMQSHDVVHTGDTVEITFSRATHEPKEFRARATIDGSPMSLEVTFGAIEYGPFHPARSVTKTQWQGFQLTIVTENSDYSK